MFGSAESELMVKLFRMYSHLCDHNPPTLQTDRQTDGQTDDMRSQYRGLHYSASRGKNAIAYYTAEQTRPNDRTFGRIVIARPCTAFSGHAYAVSISAQIERRNKTRPTVAFDAII